MSKLQTFPVKIQCGILAMALVSITATALGKGELKVCSDPDNLPFSNRKQQGFENKIAAELAKDMHAKLKYTWLKQRQGYIRQTLGEERCDVVLGVPKGYERVLSTQSYYRSGYVFVTASKRHLSINSFDDPNLGKLKIGLHAIGKDGANSPPAMSLAKRGIVQNLEGYSMWGEASEKNPQAKLVDDVAKGKIDVAIVWGPVAGYFAKDYGKTLAITPIPGDAKMPEMPFAYEMAMGVRKDDAAFAARLDQSLERKRSKIQSILTAYNVPLFNQSADLRLSQSIADQAVHENQNKR